MTYFLSISTTVKPVIETLSAEINVEGFGRINNANLKFAPLTVLVGKNNTGKSYIASLLWAFRSVNDVIFVKKYKSSLRAPSWFRDYVLSAHDQKNINPLEIKGSTLTKEINQWLKKNKDQIVQNIFSYEDARVAKLEIKLEGDIWLSPRKSTPKEIREFRTLDYQVGNAWHIGWSNKKPGADKLEYAVFTMNGEKEEDDYVDDLYFSVINKFLFNNARARGLSAVYVPAARTGLMLSLPSLYASLIENFGITDEFENRGRFSLPTIRFLQQITRERQNSPIAAHAEIAQYLEVNILKGAIIRDSTKATSFSYQPSGTKTKLPLHVASSMVSELTPLLTVLRQGYIGHGLILEEPEAHLHLSAQRWMARAIARLVNAGVPVVVTTHSDTFLQQINLLIQLHAHPDREALMSKYGYLQDELINIDRTIAYEFCPAANGTEVRSLPRSQDGLIVNSLNDVLYRLAQEALDMDEN